jgi:hypothetical protein
MGGLKEPETGLDKRSYWWYLDLCHSGFACCSLALFLSLKIREVWPSQ